MEKLEKNSDFVKGSKAKGDLNLNNLKENHI